MREALTFGLTFCCLLLAPNLTSLGQGKASRTPVVAEESSSREQDGLNGPVRRVRVETAKITVKDGNSVEGPRVLRGIATYDPLGRKIDSVAYPVEGSNLLGKEQYRYDEKGNIVEMVLRGDDGSTLSKETYEYEFDQLGNWKKMTSSVAVYENDKVNFEPIEVTYRTIAYYYGQGIDKLASSAAKIDASGAKPATTTAKDSKPSAVSSNGAGSTIPLAEVPIASKGSTVTTGAGPTATPAIKPAKDPKVLPVASTGAESSRKANDRIDSRQIDDRAKKAADNGSSSAVTDKHQSKPAENVLVATSSAATVPPVLDNATSPPKEKVSINRVSEDVLRSAAIKLPKPEYSAAARLAGASGRIEVHIIVDEKGEVVTARAMSGNPLLTDEAETAARKSSFLRSKLSSDPGKIYGVISYDFERPTTESSSPVPSSVSVSDNTKTKPAEGLSNSSPTKPTSVSSPAQPNSTRDSSDSAKARNEKELTYPSAKPNAETVATLKQAVQLDPNNAVAYIKLGLAYSARNEYKEAVPVLKMATRINPNDANAYIKLGLAYSALNEYKEAVSAFKMGVRLSPELVDAEAYYQLGNAYLAIGKYSDALDALKQALYITRAEAIDPNKKKAQTLPSPDELHYSLGRAYHTVKNYREAIKELLEAITLNPTLAEGHFSLAIAYIDSGDPKSAEKQMNILRSLDPDLAERIAGILSSKEPGRCRNGTGLCR